MASSPPNPPNAQTLYCRSCKNEFISYKVAGLAECPRCGRPVQPPPRHRYSRLVAAAILAGVAVAAIIAYAILRR